MKTSLASIPEAFDQAATHYRGRAALAGDAVQLTYGQLAAKADGIGTWLRARGIGRGHTVGLFAQRSVDTIAAILGILKAGAAYVPLDPAYPRKLLQYIYEDSLPSAMLVQRSLVASRPQDVFWKGEALSLDADMALPDPNGGLWNWPEIEPDDVAYIMYTSGSTGRPKGVIVPHRAVLRLVLDTDFAALGPDEVILQMAPLSFDASTFEIWGALLNGGKLAVVSNPYPSLDDIAAEIARHGVTTLWLTAGLFHLMVDNNLNGLKPLRQLLAGGDVLSPPHIVKALRALPGCRLINGYGPTENTTFSCCYTVPRDYDGTTALPIGKPIRQTDAYILDESLQPVSVGSEGELYVGGAGVALGYLKRPQLTAERFIQLAQRPGSAVYKTGDRVRMRADGNIEFLGRQDRQVKINGKRVELDEIEARIRATGLAQDAAVVCPPGAVGHRSIIAFVTAKDSIDLEQLRRILREDLPDYMIPSSITQLASFPLSPTGKVDRAQLPAVAPAPAAGFRGRAPVNATEAALRDIWRKVLGSQAVGVDDNFFDLGGTSLGLMEVHAHIKRSMSSDITVVEMFQYPRISALAERMTRTAPARTHNRGAQDPSRGADSSIAIVGMSGRFPGARNVSQFWENLRNGVESITRFSESELEDSFSDEVRSQPNFVKARPILEDVDQFDADFFGMYAREAELTDPQHRVFLECAWEALESAGCDPRGYTGAISVFAGASIGTYFLEHVLRDRRTIEEFTSSYQVGCYPMLLGTGYDFLSTRVAYKLDLKGPAVTLSTACSTSLLAVAQACQSLICGQSDLALAGGVSITFPQKRGYLHLEGGMVSADGSCRTFDANASGTIFGSGAGVVALKRLSDAQRDGDHIFAIVRGCGVNNDGAAKVGFTAPSIDGQAAAIEMAHANAGIDARSISYVECHGTATPLGDPIEVAALTKAFQATTSDKQFCAVGSVKSNIGHLDAGAGVVGLIKTALSLEHGVIPPSLHYTAPNPQIDFASTPFYVNSKLTEWPRHGGPRRAGVSAFGVGGTNVHIVLEEAPPLEAGKGRSVEAGEVGAQVSELLVVSARSETALAAARANLAAYLRANTHARLADVAHTLQVGRREFEHRAFVVGHTAEDAASRLESGTPAAARAAGAGPWQVGPAPGPTPASGAQSLARHGKGPAIAFMFPGQGSQYPDMARDLYVGEPEFRLHFDRCAQICRSAVGEDLAAFVYPAVNSPEAAKRLMNTKFAQPAIFAIEYSLASLWMSWGIQPSAMIGHSVGEFVAAVMAGVMSLEDALPLVALRGRLMQELHRGSMLSVRLPERELRPLLGPDVAIAAVNGPSLTVASGPDAAIQALEKTLQERGVICRHLHTSHAFHSAMVEPIIEPLRERLEQIRLSPPTLPYVSCVTGTWIKESEATSTQYWARHARETVRFADGIKTLLCMESSPVLLEVGPGNVLSTLSFQALQGAANPVVTSLQDSARESSDRACMLEALGRLWSHGAQPNWSALHAQPLRRVPLPTYPFERKRFWIDAPPKQRNSAAAPVAGMAGSPLFAAPADVVAPAPVVSQDITAMTQPNTPPAAASPLGGRIEELSAAIAAILENLSGTAPPSTTAPISFLEMGFDSLFLTQVAQKIQSQMKVKITFRQLLAQYSTIPSLAAFLADKVPLSAVPARAPVAPATAVAPAAAPAPVNAAPTLAASMAVSAGPAPMSLAPATFAAQAAPGAGVAASVGGLEGLFRDQLNTMSQLISRQFDVLQGLGLRPGAAPAGTTIPAAVINPAVAGATPSATETAQPSRFAVFNPKEAPSSKSLSAEQQAHVKDLIARYNGKTAGSKRYTEEHRSVLADPRAASGFRTEWKELVYPIVTDRCRGSKLWDLDGNEYVDLVNGFGQTAFGHSPDFVTAAIKEQLDKGFAIGPQAELAGKVAGLFCELTGNDRMTFCNTGSEAVMAAMRLARTVTGREKIVIFNGDYHGQFDEVLVKGVQRTGAEPRSMPVAPGIPSSAVENMIVLDYATPETLQWVRDNVEDLAAVIVEPVQSRHPSLRPFEFLREIRKITEAAGTAFVMDEVVTGFRTHPGGIQALAGVRADMATYGKVVGGGLPIGILAGNRKFMDALDGGSWRFGDDSFPEVGVTFFAGTFVRHPLVLASAWAVLNHIKTQGPQMQERLAKRTSELAADLNELFQKYGLKTKIETYASWFFFNIHGEHPNATLLFYHLRLRGVHIQDGFPCFLTTAHSEADFQLIYNAFAESVAALNAVGILGAPRSGAVGAGTSGAAATGAGRVIAASGASADAGVTVSNGSADTGIPLTESQTEIWLAAQMGDEASCAFNESVSLTLHGTLNEQALRSALTLLLERHDALRATFTATGEEMRISAAGPVNLPVVDLTREPNAQNAAEQAIVDDARTPFDLVNGPAARFQLLRLADDHHILMFTGHHIIIDGWSINVVVSELAEIYPVLCEGGTPQWEPALRFSTYARDQAKRDPEEAAKTESYWLNQYREPTRTLDLPTDRPRPALKSYAGASRCRRIDASLYQSLKKSGAKAGNTLFVTLLGAFQALVGRLSDQTEVVVGVPTAGQSLLEEQILVGHCVNFLPIRGTWSETTAIGEHLRSVSKSVLDAYEHQSYTLGTLVRKLKLAREQNRVPLAEIQFNLERLADRIQLPGLNIDVAPNSKAAVNFDLFLNVIESESGLRLDCDYNTDLFDAATIDLWLNCYQVLLESIVADPAAPVVRINYLPAAERQRVLADYNRTQAPFPNICVHRLFEQQVAERPQALAARFRDDSMTYESLNRRANQLANLLLRRIGAAAARKNGAPQPLVAVVIDRSLDMLVALLATLKAGCAYVPLDPTHPAQRLRHILKDAGVAAVITDGTIDIELPDADVPTINIRKEIATIAATTPALPAVNVQPGDLAYVIYTSGSTGLPKGVEVPHSAVVNFLTSMALEPGLSRADVLLAVTTISFDIAGLELFLPLSVGAQVVIAESDEVIDGFVLLQHLEHCGATVMQATPATWRMLLEAGFQAGAGFKMLCGGEALPREVANRLLAGAGELWNMYGPTETTIWSSCTRVTSGDSPITVGKPIANTQFLVLDRNDQPVPHGVAGQLHIGGDGVARGYHNRDELTAQKFVRLSVGSGAPGSDRLYRTGDLAKWLPNEQLQVLGRIDHQVKLRGFRIETGEIEAVLVRKAGLKAVAVILREDNPGVQRLVAYYVEPAGSSPSAEQLRTLLADDLPEYMIPTAWMKLDRLPVSPNGKLDRGALPKPEPLAVTEAEFAAPQNQTEIRLAKIWADVLHLSRVSVTMDLLKLGADSIQLFQMIARSSREGFRVSAKQLLQHRTVRGVAALLDGSPSTESAAADTRSSLPTLGQFKRNRTAATQIKR